MNELQQITAASWWRMANAGNVTWIDVSSWCFGAQCATAGPASEDWMELSHLAARHAFNSVLPYSEAAA